MPVRSAVDELFDLSSVTKTFTATLLADLAAGGVVDLDDPLSRFVPRDQRGPTDVTLRALASHTAGLPAGGPLATLDEVLDALASAPLSPRGQYRYSNLAYTLLGHVISTAASMPFPSFATERILIPLGMTSTAFESDLDGRVLAKGARADTGEPVGPRDPVPLPGAGNLWTTPTDLLRWATAWVDPPPSLADAMDLALQPQVRLPPFAGVPFTWRLPSLPGRRAIGLAWRIEHDGLVWHTGGSPGFTTFCGFNRRDGSATVALVASGMAHLPDSVRSLPIVERFLRYRATVIATARAGRLVAAGPVTRRRAPRPPSPRSS